MKSKILVTGGAGFIGSNLCRYLHQTKKCEVVVLDDLSGGERGNVPDFATFIHGSITDVELVDKLFAEKRFDFVYHFAAYAAEGLSHFIRRYNYTNNIVGSVNLINASVKYGVKCFLFTSSIAVYGPGQTPMHEEAVPEPEDPYGIAKLAVEYDLKAAFRMFGLNYVIFRPHNVYGEYQNIGDKYRNVVGIFMNQILSGRPMTIFGDGEQMRAFSYIGDIVPPIAEAAWMSEAHQNVFNIGADRPYTVNALATEVARAMGAPGHVIQHLAARQEVKTAYSDHAKVRKIFGEGSHTPLSEGLARMAKWARETGYKESARFSNIEVTKNLPQSWA